MKVILTNEVLGLGDPGEVVQVKNGYGRNYLIPQGLALEATHKNIKALEVEMKRIAASQAREVDKVKSESQKLAGTRVSVTARAGEAGKLYGSVTSMQVAAALAELGFDIDRRRILMDGPIKKLGQFTLQVKLHPQVVIDIELEVVPEAGSGPENPPPPEQAQAPPEAAGDTAEPAPEAEAPSQTEAAAEEQPKE